ncbi:hypothetical protein [Rufibacter ruber]|uniref:hypothetical protein n=1 Tax=Rufibacter ruber TaxID=1783499 RepID=UPI000836DF6C|nr:hypothetical protein [Rufibacter ruber]
MVKEYRLEFLGKWLSINEAYSVNRWKRNAVKKEWNERFKLMIAEAGIQPFTVFELEIVFRSRMDVENVAAGTKILVDTLKTEGIIPNDDGRYYKSFTSRRDQSLAHNTHQITIRVIEE